jgi:AraC-like DNA-binding protein|tara:strand:- start:573 stop:1619 length:1047 start_codon:yes stop_codon:yes gene_type:complete
MTLIDAFILLRGASLGVLLVIILIAVKYRNTYAAKLLIALAVGGCGYILAPVVRDNAQLLDVSVMITDTTPLIFLLFCQAIFNDHKKPAKLSLAMGVSYYITGYLAHPFGYRTTIDLPLDIIDSLNFFSHLLILVSLLYAFGSIIRQSRNDLVASRRQLRLIITTLVGGYISLIIIMEMVIPGFSLWVEAMHSAGILLVMLGLTMGLLAIGTDNLTIISKPAEISAVKKTETALEKQELAALLYAMETDCSYRNMELTISSLAAQISVPEHHLRSLINRHLDYRNFNDFLNQYRIAETAQRLTNEKFAKLPIMTIAMDAGYRSMTTFNKAFKSITGKTPRDYRFNNSE